MVNKVAMLLCISAALSSIPGDAYTVGQATDHYNLRLRPVPNSNYSREHIDDSNLQNGKLESYRCKKVAEQCRDECSSSCLPTCNYGFKFWNCVNKCKTKHGC